MNNMQLKFEAGNNKGYKVDDIWDSAIYARELAGQLSGFYYLVLKKATLRRRIPKSLHWQFSIFKNLLLLIIKTIQKS